MCAIPNMLLLACCRQPLARVLAPYWEEIETNYINSSKTVFRKVRGERERIIRYLFSIRQNFVAFLKRPDHKQEFVSDWQKVRLKCLLHLIQLCFPACCGAYVMFSSVLRQQRYAVDIIVP